MNRFSSEFHDRIVNFTKANPGMRFIIAARPAPEDQERQDAAKRAWFTYLSVKGLTGTLETWRAILGGQGKAITVPCELPDYFDPSYVAPKHQWTDVDQRTEQGRRDVQGTLARARAAARPPKPDTRGPTPKDHIEQRKQTFDEWERETKANPPPVPVFSDEFREKFGLPPREQEGEAA